MLKLTNAFTDKITFKYATVCFNTAKITLACELKLEKRDFIFTLMLHDILVHKVIQLLA